MTKINKKLEMDNRAERPIGNSDKDAFQFNERIVNKIKKILNTNTIMPLTIAITGELGIGKSSVINLLKNEIDNSKSKKTIKISFDPLLEGKLEIIEMIELFYLQLYKQIKDPNVKRILAKAIKGIALISRFKAKATFGLPFLSQLEIEKDVGKDIDDLLKLFEKSFPKLFSEQAEEINNQLKKKYQLYVFIDEIDRLTAENMINFLLFSRILELFDNLICIVGIDYTKAIDKLIKEGHLGLSDYNAATSYLDKLFQYKFHVSINIDKKIQFAKRHLQEIDID